MTSPGHHILIALEKGINKSSSSDIIAAIKT